ncbi:hypothetical protein K458DRAFT_417570 [Lentithecium fluviatile CBS 122367]|uniref:Uncharacterized protein n=1 Tax=Lentithecium fluviatile CBS 122367 TaxID=1168545 RepID=A0A6G1J2G2_9PLEO|nr:hypothetical protein K458DRAFT_417570 [Lentithecium fluviatile CBS 122367]
MAAIAIKFFATGSGPFENRSRVRLLQSYSEAVEEEAGQRKRSTHVASSVEELDSRRRQDNASSRKPE